MTNQIPKSADDLIAIYKCEYELLDNDVVFTYLFENKVIKVIQTGFYNYDKNEYDCKYKNDIITNYKGINAFREQKNLSLPELMYLSDEYEDELTAQLL